MSSRNQYDSGESRRSPRDRSPGRYNDGRDDYRGGGPSRGNERRRSPIPDARASHSAFASNRNNFRDPVGREPSRDFPPRDPPRGPKGLIDAPTGPRSNSYSSDFRGDFGGYRGGGDFRGRGRARGRGWREDSRDRGREPDRDYRDRRDDRPRELFRDDRSRDRDGWDREPFRGRRPNSPPGRGRSPNYGSRDARDGPPPLSDLDRRVSRDPASGAPSPSSEGPSQFARGYGRTRGSRGRGRGFYDEYSGPRRSRSPDPPFRRAQRSATPPPQVPAFGSTSNNLPVSSTAPPTPVTVPPSQPASTAAAPAPVIPVAPRAALSSTTSTPLPSAPSQPVNSTAPIPTAPRSLLNSSNAAPSAPTAPAGLVNESTSGPLPGVAIPTAPRGHVPSGPSPRHPFARAGAKVTSLTWTKPKQTSPEIKSSHDAPEPSSAGTDSTNISSSSRPNAPQASPRENDVSREESKPQSATAQPAEPAKSQNARAAQQNNGPEQERRRRPIIGKRPGRKLKVSLLPEVPEDGSDSDSGDFDDDYFDGEIAKKEAQIKELTANNPLTPRAQPPIFFLEPFRSATISQLVQKYDDLLKKECVAPAVTQSAPADATSSTTLAPKPRGRGKSRPVSPLPELNGESKSSAVKAGTPEVNGGKQSRVNGHHAPSIIVPPAAVDKKRDLPDQVLGASKSPKTSLNGFRSSSPAVDTAELVPPSEEELQKVRSYMKTPPLESLPDFGNKGPWFEDAEFVHGLEVRNAAVQERIKRKIRRESHRQEVQDKDEAQKWKERYFAYRQWTDFSADPIAVRSRERFAASKAKTAAEAAAPTTSAIASVGAKPEGQRRTGSRWASEADYERVLQESAQEAKEQQEREDRVVRERTANAKEATIPAMVSKEAYAKTMFVDRTHIVPLERSFSLLEFGEPIDNFTEEETQIFEKVYIEHPKQWTKIAEALPRRDYKACIQHYYKIKHSSNLKEKLKKSTKKRRGKGAARGPKPRSNALITDIRDETEDGQDTENGSERRRPRRAAAPTWPIEAPQSESEVASPAPTPGRKTTAAAKDSGTEGAAPKRGRGRGGREKGAAKQAKNNQLLAAAPIAAARRAESPALSAASSSMEFKVNQQPPIAAARFAPQYDASPQNQRPYAPFVPAERPISAMPTNFEPVQQPTYQPQERPESATPSSFDAPQDRRSTPQTSSYWSVPETTDFPVLLRHFGTDWHAIAKFMTSKTHIMVYQSVFTWLIQSDSNKSRRMTNIAKQVKNFYQRQVDSGKRDWEVCAMEADAKKARGEPTGPLPQAPAPLKRRYDAPSNALPRSGSAIDSSLDDSATSTPVPSHASPPQSALTSRFPTLAQAGPVPHQPAPPTSAPNKHLTPQPIQQSPAQGVHTQRPSRGPPIGYFVTERAPLQADNPSQRSLQAAQEAQLERSNALRLEREQREQQQQQQALQRERVLQLKQEHKQEHETPNPQQFEPYSTPGTYHGNLPPQQRIDVQHAQNIAPRSAPPQQPFQPRSQTVQNLLSNNVSNPRDVKSTPSPAVSRGPMSAPPATHEPFSAPSHPMHHAQSLPPQHTPLPQQTQQPPPPAHSQPPLAVPRQQETVRKTSNLMALLNNDEPSDPRPAPTKRLSDVSSGTIQQRSQTPPIQHNVPPSHYSHSSHPSLSSQPTSQPQHQMGQQITSQQASQQVSQHRHSYSQGPVHSLHQHSGSIDQPRNYTPTGFDSRSYGSQAMQQQQPPPQSMQKPQPQSQHQQQHQLFSQPSRQSISSQPPSGPHRESSQGDIHGSSHAYSRPSAPQQPSSMRMKDSPYSASTQAAVQSSRPPSGSPRDVAPPSDRDYYQRPPYLQQQSNSVSSPQVVPSYQTASQQQPSHRHLAFGQNQGHVASPPTSYASHRPVQPSRQSSLDSSSRYPLAATSAPALPHHGYSQAPQHQPQHVPLQYQQQQQQQHRDRLEYDQQQQQRDRDRRLEGYERDRRYQDDLYQRRPEDRR